jgi:hypothetical protein
MAKKIKSVKKKDSCLLVPIEEAHLLMNLCDKGIISKDELRKKVLSF